MLQNENILIRIVMEWKYKFKLIINLFKVETIKYFKSLVRM